MKTLLLIALTFTGITLFTPEAQARDRHSDRGHYSYRYSRPSYGHSHYRGGHSGYRYYSRSYYSSSPRYYSRPSSRYYYSDRCEPERRRSHRSPLISFLFGF